MRPKNKTIMDVITVMLPGPTRRKTIATSAVIVIGVMTLLSTKLDVAFILKVRICAPPGSMTAGKLRMQKNEGHEKRNNNWAQIQRDNKNIARVRSDRMIAVIVVIMVNGILRVCCAIGSDVGGRQT
jgi:hypothetical protein